MTESTRRLNTSIRNPLLRSLLSRPNPFGSWGGGPLSARTAAECAPQQGAHGGNSGRQPPSAIQIEERQAKVNPLDERGRKTRHRSWATRSGSGGSARILFFVCTMSCCLKTGEDETRDFEESRCGRVAAGRRAAPDENSCGKTAVDNSTMR